MGGCETVLSTRMHELQSLGVDAHMIFFEGGEGEKLFEDLGDRVSICQNSSDVEKKLSALQPDFVLSLDTPQIRKHLDRRLSKIKYVYEVHTPYPDGLKRLKHQSWRGVSAILTPTHAHRELILSLLNGKIDCPVEVVPNPLRSDFSIYPKTPAYPRPIVIWVGRLDPHKNWRMFIDICQNLNLLGADMEYWIVGTTKISPVQKTRLWEQIKKAKLASRFRWLPFVQYEKMDRLLSFAAASGGCLVYTSHLESFGMAAAEAMASSCPVVVPDVGGFHDFVINGETGYRYPPGNTRAAVDFILKSIQDASARSRITAAGYQRVHDKYSARIAVLKLIDTLQNLANSNYSREQYL
jgi:glycosyltransferase involved in cell wall biosynthesis